MSPPDGRGGHPGQAVTRAVVHIGTNKAGSTSLQHGLIEARERLLAESVLLPARDGRPLRPREVHDLLRPGTPSADRETLVRAIDAEVARHRPDVILLSSEYLFLDPGCAGGIAETLPRWAEDVSLVLYLREPAAYYLSVQQQGLRGGDRAADPRLWRAGYRDLLSLWRATFGARLTVVPFQRSSLRGPPAADFLSRAVPEAGTDLSAIGRTESNTGDPPEVTVVLEANHRVFHPGAAHLVTARAKLLREVLI